MLLKAYINLVSADTYLLGCAGADIPGMGATIITCNYGPVMGTSGSVYIRGTAGSACPDGTTKEAATGLCA